MMDNKACVFCCHEDAAMLLSGDATDQRLGALHLMIFIAGDLLFANANFLGIQTKICFCPMCGRKLERKK